MHQLRPVEVSPGSVVGILRDLIPRRPLSCQDALRMAERTSSRLLKLFDIHTLPVPTGLVTTLPRVAVEVDWAMPTLTSGSSVWDSTETSWVITLNGREPTTRQRFTLMHEFFHIMVHRHVERARLLDQLSPAQVEYVADYFAGCVLVPKRLLTDAWASGIQRSGALAEIFDVSPRAIEVRLAQVRLTGNGDEYRDFTQYTLEAS